MREFKDPAAVRNRHAAKGKGQVVGTGEIVPPAFTVRERMEVVGECGNFVGFVERVEGTSIKLRKDSQGQDHYIPMSWVDHTDQQIHLNRTCRVAKQQWETADVD